MIKRLVLFTITLVFLLCPQVEANEHSVSKIKETIVKQSLELGVDPALALSIARAESGFKHEARSRYGAVGVFQLMPSTAKYLGVNPYYLSDNIKGGLMYYKKMYKMFGSMELALAAYNAGPGTVHKYKKTIPPIGETKKFVSNIMSEYKRQQKDPDPAIIKITHKKELIDKKTALPEAKNTSKKLKKNKKIVKIKTKKRKIHCKSRNYLK